MNLHNLVAWWHTIWHHFHHDTLSEAPSISGLSAVIAPPNPSLITPPAPTTIPVLHPVSVPDPTPAAPTLVPWPPGVTLVDSVNGLVRIDAAEAINPGQLYACQPSLASLDPHSQAFATVAYNCAYGKAADEGLGMHLRVNTMIAVPEQNALTPGFTNSNPIVWIPNAWTVGAEYVAWETAINRAVFMATAHAELAAPRHGG